MSIQKSFFGTAPNGTPITEYRMWAKDGICCSVLNYGGILRQLLVPDKNGCMADVVCGFDSAEDYFRDKAYHGALIGRVANRIANATFSLNGKSYTLTKNLGNHAHHGGVTGVSRQFWQVTPVDGASPQLILRYFSPDGDGGFPGNLEITVTYTLKTPYALSIRYQARTDEPTPVNLSNHAYFNLGGYSGNLVSDHELWMDATHYLENDEGKLPTGQILPVTGTPLDFTVTKPIGRDIETDFPAVRDAGGYDHCYVFADAKCDLPHRATLFHPASGREMKVYTTQPALQLYTANVCNENLPLKGGFSQKPHFAVCLETQKMTDSVHHPNFTDTVLLPGQKYDHTTEYVFSVK